MEEERRRRWYAAVAVGYLVAFTCLSLVLAEGMALGVAKTYVTRRAAIYWVRSFGRVPPGMDEPDAKDKVRLSRLARGKS